MIKGVFSFIFCLFFWLSFAQSQEKGIVEVEVDSNTESLMAADQESDTENVNSIEEIMNFRDPFKGPDLQGMNLASAGSNALLSFPTSDFKLLGVVTGPKRLKAMLLAPDGKTYFVKTKDRIGIRSGVIQKILKDRLIVKEKVINLLGKEEQIYTAILMDSDEMSSMSTN